MRNLLIPAVCLPLFAQAPRFPLSQLVAPMSAQIGRPIIDKTGLTALYEIDLRWTPERIPQNFPTLFTAVQEQLGLKLDSGTGPLEVLLIDRVEKATENRSKGQPCG